MVFSWASSFPNEGLSRDDVVADLGEPDARYLSDANLTYRVGPQTVESRFGKGYLFSLIPDTTNGRFVRFWIMPFPPSENQ